MEYIDTTILTNDEFNNLTIANCAAYVLKQQGCDSTVVCERNYNSIYTYADQTINKIDKDISCVNHMQLLEDYIGCRDAHYYRVNFGAITKMMLEENNNYRFATCDGAFPEQPYVVIHGRNLSKHPFRNNTFHALIQYVLQLGYTVYNTTMYSPKFNLGDQYHENDYIEDYNKQVTLMNHANIVFAIATSAGINVHATVKCNLGAIFDSHENWIKNPNFGYKQESVLSARAKITTVHTSILTSPESVAELCKLTPPN